MAVVDFIMRHLRAPVRRLAFWFLSVAILALADVTAQEFRGLWVDSFHPGLRNRREIRQLVADARAGNFNALIVEVRRRGDAFYNSRYEPKATDITPPDFDPLAELIALAHLTNSGPPLQVHAWIVAYNIWDDRRTLPTQANHPYRQHRDWVTRTDRGVMWDGASYAFDPGHPDVQQHTFDVAMDIVSRYDVDGLHLDYIRYAGNDWGYNEAAVSRFKIIFSRVNTPFPEDPQWLQFRRDQVTALVRKIYLSALELKPRVTISAATIAWAPGIASDSEWPGSAAFSIVLQDWRAWMQEGILDLNVPMVYFRQQTVNSNNWASWSRFAKDHRYNRGVAIGTAVYLNNVSRSLSQMRSTRNATTEGNRADGLVIFSYAMPGSDRVSRSDFLKALTGSGRRDPGSTPLFPTPVDVPEMPWKTSPTRGHLKGYVTSAPRRTGIDAATVTLTGPVNRSLISDATGFYGTVDLPTGDYLLSVKLPNYQPAETNVTIAAGAVASRDWLLNPANPPPTADKSSGSRDVVPVQSTQPEPR